MGKLRLFVFLLMSLLLVNSKSYTAEVTYEQILKPRLFVLTDIENEPDDAQSMVRLMTYSNQLEIEGLVATTSCWLIIQARSTERLVRCARGLATRRTRPCS